MTEAQQALAEQIALTLGRDPRVRSVWLTGSLGQGKGDRWSDVDILAVVEAGDMAACLADHSREGLPEAVLSRVIFGRIITAVAPDWSRYDVTFTTPEEFARADGSLLKPLAGEVSRPPPALPPEADDPAPALGPLIEEFLRVLGMAPVVFGREEWLVSQQGIDLLRNMLIDLMLVERGVGRAGRGAKRLNEFLGPEQRAILEGLEPPLARREALLAANEELAHLFLTRARPLAAAHGVPWPEALEASVRTHLHAELGLQI